MRLSIVCDAFAVRGSACSIIRRAIYLQRAESISSTMVLSPCERVQSWAAFFVFLVNQDCVYNPRSPMYHLLPLSKGLYYPWLYMHRIRPDSATSSYASSKHGNELEELEARASELTEEEPGDGPDSEDRVGEQVHFP